MEGKTFVFENGGTDPGLMGFMSGMLNKQGIDPNVLALMNKNGDGMFGGSGGGMMMMLFLLLLLGRNGLNGFGNELNSPANNELLLNAINGNNAAIRDLAAATNTSIQSVQNALCQLNTGITQLGGQIGMSTQQIINSIQSGNCQLATQLSNGFCDVKGAITTQGYEARLAECNQTNTLVNTMNANNQAVLARIDAFEHSQLQDKIQTLRERNLEQANEISQRDQNAVIAGMVAPINARLAAIECHQLPTYPQTYIPGIPFATYQAPFGHYGHHGCDPCHGRNW